MKFNGKNYYLWERKVHNALAQAEVLQHALAPKLTNTTAKFRWLVADLKAVAIIEDHLSDRILTQVPSWGRRYASGLDWDRTESQSYLLLKHIRDRYKESSIRYNQDEFDAATREGRTLQEFYDHMLSCWSEIGGEVAMSCWSFCDAVARRIDPGVEWDRCNRVYDFLTIPSVQKMHDFMEMFEKILLLEVPTEESPEKKTQAKACGCQIM
jgi:hypothetical protein